MELRDYLRIVRRRWALIAVCALLTVAAAAIVTLRTTPQYASTARFFISTPQSAGADAYQGGLFSEQRVASYADLVTGESLAQRVANQLSLRQPASELSEQVTSNVVPETIILEATVTDPDPQRAQAVAQALSGQFTRMVAELETPPGKKRPPIKATLVDRPDVPSSAVSPQPLRNVGLGAILGLLLGLGAAMLREILDSTVKSADDVKESTGSVLLGNVHYDSRAARNPLVTDLAPHAPRVEAFRMLRTNLQFVDVDQQSKVFVVTSALPEEGKSTTAVNLAITLAQAGQRVLLLEADLRRPRVSEYLHLEPTVGLTTVLIGRVPIDDTVQAWGDHGLHVITSGSVPPNPAEMLQSMAMDDTIGKLRGQYDVILIDAPPLLPVTDAALLAARADGALLIVRHGKTTKDQARLAADRLAAVDAKLLGILFNMTPERDADEYGYGYGYGYAPQQPAQQRTNGWRKADRGSARQRVRRPARRP